MRVVVIGAGVAGLGIAIAASRAGHEVVVLERDPTGRVPDLTDVPDRWDRRGVGQFRQPHNFLGLGRRLLRDRLPDVYRAILAAGAVEVKQFQFLPEHVREPADADLATIGCRRPLFEAVLRLAAEAEPHVDLRVGCRVTGLAIDPTRAVGRHPSGGRGDAAGSRQVAGVRIDGDVLSADLVVDASGRGSHTVDWVRAEGLGPVAEQTSNCGLLYYSRHFQLRDNVSDPPYASVLAGPRGDLGYLAYAIFVGDNRTFCLCVMPATSDRDFRRLREPDAFLALASRLPGVASWVDPDAARPISPVLPMGHLTNTIRRLMTSGGPVAPGLQPIGDPLCHTNPTFAYGASLALQHAFTLADLLDDAVDHVDLAQRFDAAVGGDLELRYRAVTAEDRDRARLWGGEPIDVRDPRASLPLFLRSVVYRVAPADPRLLRAVVRRIDLLDPPDRLERDADLHALALDLYRDAARRNGLGPPGPGRAELLATLTA